MKKTFLLLFFVLFWGFAFSQNLDRISLSSGGAATDQVNYVIGETFNFTMASGGNIIIETGSLASEDNTGGDNSFTIIKEIASTSPLKCYPNPVSDYLKLETGSEQGTNLNLLIYNQNGQVVYNKTHVNQNELLIDFSNLSTGVYYLSVKETYTEDIKAVKIVKQ